MGYRVANRSPGMDSKLITKKCIVYDVFETDLNKKVIAKFDNPKDCGKFLGLTPDNVKSIMKGKSRNKKNALNKVITIRETV